jgi:hypothetical protein
MNGLLDAISSFVDGLDLSVVHTVLAIYGGLATIFVMQTNRYEAEDYQDSEFVRGARTFGLIALSGSMFWSLTYGESRDWQAWPPYVLSLMAVDLLMTIRIIAVWARIRREGRYRQSVPETQKRQY